MRTAGVLLDDRRQHMQRRCSQSGLHVNSAAPTRFLRASYALPTRFLGTLLTPESALFPGQKQGLQEAALVEFMRTAGVLLVNCRQHMQQRGSQSGMHVNWAVPTRFSHASYALPTRFLGTLLTPKSALPSCSCPNHHWSSIMRRAGPHLTVCRPTSRCGPCRASCIAVRGTNCSTQGTFWTRFC